MPVRADCPSVQHIPLFKLRGEVSARGFVRLVYHHRQHTPAVTGKHLMTATSAEKRKWTRSEYLAFEREASDKHELWNGELFAMAGATREHNRIVSNLNAVLWNATRNGPCEPYPSDMKVRIPGTDNFCYPDALVVCGPQEFDIDGKDVLLNPSVICEVLSPNTESYDRGEKFFQYRTIQTVSDYVLLSQERVRIEHFVRKPDGSWLMRDLGAGGYLRLSIGCEVIVDEIYLKVFSQSQA